MTVLMILLSPIIIKILWVVIMTTTQEEKDVVRRANYLISKVATTPQQLLSEMPRQIGAQFQGEWAIYSCSMTCKALANIMLRYPKYDYTQYFPKIIDLALSKEIREYDRKRFGEDPIEGIQNGQSHLSYYSHLAWMIGEYKTVCKDAKYDDLYHALCEAMNRRIAGSSLWNIPTYPGEMIYIPDMLVALVALARYNQLYKGVYQETVDTWIRKAKTEWIAPQTGLLASYMYENGDISPLTRGSYSALNCYYLSLVDMDFAKKQYQCLKKHFKQTFPITGIKEYCNEKCWFGFDIDAGPIIFNLSPSGTAFAIGCATALGDRKYRRALLVTAEVVGSTVTHKGKSCYLLAKYALVGEAIVLGLKTTKP